jgi:hypothetical protein
MSERQTITTDWGSPEQVEQCCAEMQRVETARAQDRALINTLANGGRPWTQAEVEKYQIQLNINWLQLSRKLLDAIGQINAAFIPPGNFFSCHSESGNVTRKAAWSQNFTAEINKVLKKGSSGKRHHFILRSRNASVALHGLGPLLWSNSYRLLPRYAPLEDLLIPTDTLLDFSINLTHFAVNLYLTPGELYRMACTDKHDPGWNQSAVRNVLRDLRDDKNAPFFNQSDSDWTDRPEAIAELYKQNRGFLESDAVPKAKLRAFYYQNPDDTKWYRKVVLRDNTPSQESRETFLYDGKKNAFADDIDQIIQCQFGDNSLVAPLKYHSVRGLGTLLYGPAFTLNRLTCQTMQHIFTNLLTLWRVTDPVDRDRLKAILLLQHGVMPEGASVVPNNERHQIDARLLEFGMAQMKQNLAENSTSYTSQSDQGTRKERTAFEVKAQLQMSQAMVGNVLSMMYANEIFYYEELVRRALLKNTPDPTAKHFQERCRAAGIPEKLLVAENWRIVAERVLGAGDGTLAQAQADSLMAQRQTFEPESQRKIQRLWTATLLDDPERAMELVPEEQDKSTSGTRLAESLFGTLMLGIQVPPRKGIDLPGFAAALLAMMDVKIQEIIQGDGMGTPDSLKGLATVAATVQATIQTLAQDESQKQIVKMIADGLTKALNELKAMQQRQAEAAQQAQAAQVDPEVAAKVQATTLLAETKAKLSEASTAQKLQHKDAAFQQKQHQAAEKHAAALEEKGAALGADLQTKAATAHADLVAQGMKSGGDLEAQKLKTAADIETAKAKAKNAPKKPMGFRQP